jgi:hypothetical protein
VAQLGHVRAGKCERRVEVAHRQLLLRAGEIGHAAVEQDRGRRGAARDPHRERVWSGSGDITGEAGSPGTPDALAVTASRNTLQVAITTTDRGLFHTIRFTDGNWQRFGDVEGAAGRVDTRSVPSRASSR